MKQDINHKKKKIAMFTFNGNGYAVCQKLQEDNWEVWVGVIQNNKDILLPEEKWILEDKEEKKKRLRAFNNILKNKISAVDLYKKLQKENTDDWFVWSDSNVAFKYTERLEKIGFSGLLAREEDRRMEVNRKKAKEYVKKNYPNLLVGEIKEFTDINEAIKFLEETEDLWVLKSEGDAGDVIVTTQDKEFNKNELINVLLKDKNLYEKDGFILEKMIINPIELTPQIMFKDGEVLYTTLDIENKPIGSGNIGIQTGCCSSINIKTNLDDIINEIAFPPCVYEEAKKRKGIYIADTSMYLDEKEDFYFGEFCFQRLGWDSCFLECLQSGGVSEYFNALINGENPIKKDFATGIRMFNIKKKEDKLLQIKEESKDNVFLYDAYKKNNKDKEIYSNGENWNLCVIASVGNSLKESIDNLYKHLNNTSMPSFALFRNKEDFLSEDYKTSLINRYNSAVDNLLINFNSFQEKNIDKENIDDET